MTAEDHRFLFARNNSAQTRATSSPGHPEKATELILRQAQDDKLFLVGYGK
jgi:hypothetical protein